MIEEELKKIWKDSSPQNSIKFDVSALNAELNTKMKSIERSIRRRDRREISASVIGIILHIWLAIEIPFLVSRLACILAVFWFGYVIYKLRNVQKKKANVDMSQSFSDQLKSQRDHMKDQEKLLSTVLYWYIIPPFVVNIIFFMGLGDPADYNWSNAIVDQLLPMTLVEKWRTLGFVAVFYALIVWMNKRAVKKTLKPVISQIENVQQQLESGD
ncbi:MAG: hypothetical protein RIM99_15075 [Cyclobacteriaceae bacterium]